MKIFNVILEFELDQKPAWLDKFRQKYDQKYPFHVTLKNKTTIEESKIERLKRETGAIAEEYFPIEIIFDELFLGKTSNGNCLMISARPNRYLEALQREVSRRLSQLGDYLDEDSRKFEENFQPHLTIARRLENFESAEAEKYLEDKKSFCQTKAEQLTLTIVDSDSFDQWADEKNKTRFNLK